MYHQNGITRRRLRGDVPDVFVEAFDASVERIAGFILRNVVGLAIKLKSAATQPIAVAADSRAKVRGVCFLRVAGERGKAEHNIAHLSGLVLHQNGLDSAAVV